MKDFVNLLAKGMMEHAKEMKIESKETLEDVRKSIVEDLSDGEGQHFVGVIAKWYKGKTGEELDTALE